jgi:hypothetical protein
MSQPIPSREDTLSRFAACPAKLSAALASLPPTALDLSVAPGEWSIRQTVHHLADDGDAWCMILKKAIATPGAPIRFEGFPGNEAWSAGLGNDRRSIDSALDLIDAHNRLMVELVTTIGDVWDRHVSILDENGHETQKVTVGEMIGFLGEHVDEHIAVIQAIRAQHDIKGALNGH